METNEFTRPHAAIICCQLEIHSLLDTGECSGRKVNEKILKEHGLSSTFILATNGKDQEDCIKKLKKKISKFVEDKS